MSKNNLKLVEDYKKKDQPKRIKSQLKKYCRYLMVHRGLKANTVNNYRKLARRLLTDCGTLNPSHEQLEDYMAGIYKKNYSYSFICNVALGIERYMEFLENPIKFGRPRKPKRVAKQALTEAEVAIFLAACKNIREKAILILLAYSGMRNQELCNLRVQDVDLGNNEVVILNGKGSKDHIAHIAGECCKILMAYLVEYPRSEDDYLFTALSSGNQFNTWAVRRLVKTVAARTNIKKRIYPHLFRHSLATNMIDRNANMRTLQAQLGHAFLETTMIYIETRQLRIKSEYHSCRPCYL